VCDLSFDERSDVWREEHPRANKAHRCNSCRGPILAGEVYLRVSWVGDGTAATEKACPACAAILARFADEHRFTPCPSNFLEYLEECGGPEWERAAFELRGRLRDSREVR
jgi:hypothetical protein